MTEGVYIALGSNIGDREEYLRKAVALLEDENCISLIKQSSFIETEPVGPIDQGLFLNGVIEISTTLSPVELLSTCLLIEERLGRTRTKRWGPRTVDLDIVLFGQQIIREPNLTIPHPDLPNRAFVLQPLVEIAPEFVHPISGLTSTQMLDSV